MSQPPPDIITSVSRDGTPAKAPARQAESNRMLNENDKTSEKRQQTTITPRPRRSFLDFLCCVSVQETEIQAEVTVELPGVADNDEQHASAEDSDDEVLQAHITKDYNSPGWLLPPQEGDLKGRKTLVLDLDETLVHSSFMPVRNADFIVPVEIEGTVHKVYVLKRPYVDEFLTRVAEIYEVIIYTASLSKYADPVIDLLDPNRGCTNRLFREGCCNHFGNYVKDLGRLGRDLSSTIIIDNSPTSYIFHPENAIPITSWFDDTTDTELRDLIPFLESLAEADDVVALLDEANQLASRNVLDAYD